MYSVYSASKIIEAYLGTVFSRSFDASGRSRSRTTFYDERSSKRENRHQNCLICLLQTRSLEVVEETTFNHPWHRV
ncbi:hypothetical protein CPC08DRAFT_714043, partial [Agrocybe pediades]